MRSQADLFAAWGVETCGIRTQVELFARLYQRSRDIFLFVKGGLISSSVTKTDELMQI